MDLSRNLHLRTKKFFSVCVDRFFKNPTEIRDLALSLHMSKNQGTSMSGFRTKGLLGINARLTDSIAQKILSCYFDSPVKYNRADMFFNKVPNISAQEDSYQNQGLTYHDGGPDYTKLAGEVYLTPDINLDAGTSLFKLKKGERYYKQGHGIDPEYEEISSTYHSGDYPPEMEQKHRAWNNRFEETLRFQNVYNRMVCYDGREFRRANNLYSNGDPRLTLAFFISGIRYTTLPLPRIRKFDEWI